MTAAYLNLVFSSVQLSYFMLIYQADWKKKKRSWLLLLLALERAEICLADSTADYLARRSGRVSACLHSLNCVAFLCCAFVSVYDCVRISITISYHSFTLFIWDEGFLCSLSLQMTPSEFREAWVTRQNVYLTENMIKSAIWLARLPACFWGFFF